MVFLRVMLSVSVVTLFGCTETGTCLEDIDCPRGKYCGAGGSCIDYCRTDQDCPGGTCLASGHCASGGWPEAGLDAGPDLPPRDLPRHDWWPPDYWPLPDWPKPDYWPQPDIGNSCQAIGTPCTAGGSECGSGSCLLTGAGKGVCTCTCTPDDPNTPLVVEDSCPDLTQNRCAPMGTTGMCFKLCKPKLGANDCQGGLTCDPRSGDSLGLPGAAVCAFYGCTSGADCPVRTSQSCSTTNPSTCGTGQTCIALVEGKTAGLCAKAGSCDTVSGLCGVHALGKATAKVGDPCKDDTECAGNMHCMIELDQSLYRKKGGQSCQSDSECCSGICQGTCTIGLCTVDYRGGYCTIQGCTFAATLTQRACPAGTACNSLSDGGRCQKSCALADAASCRDHPSDLYGDYECRAWNNLSLASGPVCDFGPKVPCSFFAGTSLDCAALGGAGNPTSMACRSLDGQVLANKYDATGFCLDTTASGTQLRSPLPTP